jgi:hypothetical protein
MEPKLEGFGHAYMTQDMKKEPILQMWSHKMIPRHVYDIRFPDRSEWNEGCEPDRKGVLIWYTDGSKTNKGTGAGVYCYGTWQKLSFGFGQYTTVFQAEVYAIKACAVENPDRNYKNSNIYILSVKQQLKHLTNTRSLRNWCGTAINPSHNWPIITGFN